MPLAPKVKLIRLTRGMFATVDTEDYERVNQWKWRVIWSSNAKSWYAGNKKLGLMSRFILGVTDRNLQVDHKDHNTLNNLKSNLRTATRSQNQHNKRKPSNNTSGYKGVSPSGSISNPWLAKIHLNGVRVSLGNFKTPEEASQAYKKAALALHGEFACTE